MCLSVYVGTSLPLTINASVAAGSLALESATWVPPPLRRMGHVYLAGQKGVDGKLGCSCFLSEFVRWDQTPPTIGLNDTYPDEGPCPFEALRQYCEHVLEQHGTVVLVCDDSGGMEQQAEESDYHWGAVLTDQIKRGRLIFSDPSNEFPWRALSVLPVDIVVSKQPAHGD